MCLGKNKTFLKYNDNFNLLLCFSLCFERHSSFYVAPYFSFFLKNFGHVSKNR